MILAVIAEMIKSKWLLGLGKDLLASVFAAKSMS